MNPLKVIESKHLLVSESELKKAFNQTHVNGGCIFLKIHLSEVLESGKNNNFPKKVLNKLIKESNISQILKINDVQAKVKINTYSENCFSLIGRLLEILINGGAYEKANQSEAWEVSKNFVEESLNSNFTEIDYYEMEILNAEWFYKIAWDFACFIVNKQTKTGIFIFLTDTD